MVQSQIVDNGRYLLKKIYIYWKRIKYYITFWIETEIDEEQWTNPDSL